MADWLNVPVPNITKQIIWHQKFMKETYIDEKTGQWTQAALTRSGMPLRFGFKSVYDVVKIAFPKLFAKSKL